MASNARTAKEPPKSSSRDLKDHAATAALYVTSGPEKPKNKKKTTPLLDADGKLSSASAALSLKHAQPRDLPSFPVLGLANAQSSAGAAASLAAANQTTFEHWKPDALPAANKAAFLAKDYKAEPLWEPELSSAGSKAALLAHRKSGAKGTTEVYSAAVVTKGKAAAPKTSTTTESGSGTLGSSAAGQAMRSKKSTQGRALGDSRAAWEGSAWPLTAATGAFSGERHQGPLPPVPRYPDATNSAANALNAASRAHAPRPKRVASVPNDLPGMSAADARRIHAAAVTNLSREMYTSAPPVAPEVEERNRQAGLNAAAVSMAKKMYETQQRQSATAANVAARSASTARAGRKSEADAAADDLRTAATKYLHLQEAARKLATERLAKLDNDNSAFRNYYGTATPPRRGVSLKARRRSSWSEAGAPDDGSRAERIRNQTAGLGTKLAAVDEAKRRQDREALLEAARRNVRQSMHGMDERVFADTGKASAAMQAEWEERARAQAKERSAARLETHGKVSIGGGKYLDQSEIDAIAASRVKPTLDAITAKAEADRARDEAHRQAEEQRRRKAEEKAREERERKRHTDLEWKKFKDDEKAEKKRIKEEAKARRAEEKKAQKERDEEAKWAAVHDKTRAKEEEAEAKREVEENKKAEKEHEAALAAEFDAIQREEKKKKAEKKQSQKEKKIDTSKDEEAFAAQSDEEEEEQHREESEEHHEDSHDRDSKGDEVLQEGRTSKDLKRESKAMEKEEEERDEAAQRVHELALKVRQQARESAIRQYLQQEEEKVRKEEEEKKEEREKAAKEQKEWEKNARKEELEKVDREIAAAKEEKKEEHEQTEEAREAALNDADNEPKEVTEEQTEADDGQKSRLNKTDRSSKRMSSLRSGPTDKESKRKSRGALGLGAVAAAIGIGERDKKDEQKQQLDEHADSDGSTSLESLSSSDGEKKSSNPKSPKQPKSPKRPTPQAVISTTIESTATPESSRHAGKRSSWFRRLGSRSTKNDKGSTTKASTADQSSAAKDDPVSTAAAAMVEKTRVALRGAHLAPGASASSVGTASSNDQKSKSGKALRGGKAAISGPIHTRPIQNSAGFTGMPESGNTMDGAASGIVGSSALPPTAGTSSALQPGIPPSTAVVVEHGVDEAPPALCPPVELRQNDSEAEVALAGRQQRDEDGLTAADRRRAARNLSRDSSSSDLGESSAGEGSVKRKAHGELDGGGLGSTLSGPPGLPEMTAGGSELMSSDKVPEEGKWLKSPGAGEDDDDEWQEAQDRLDTEVPKVGVLASAPAASPSRSAKFHEEL